MTVMITGGSGFLGSHLAARLVAAGREVVLVDNFATGVPDNVAELTEGATLVSGDVLDLSHLLRTAQRHGVRQIVHGAAIVGAPASIERPLLTSKVNIEGALNVLEVARVVDADRVVDLSSEETYGEFHEDVIDECHPRDATSVYGITKQAVEQLGGHYARQYDVPYVAARLCWVYGPRFPRQRLPLPWIHDALAGRPTSVARGGDHRIDFTYIDDAVDGLVLMLDADALTHRAYNIATGTAPTLREVGEEIRRQIPTWDFHIGTGRLEQYPGYETPRKGALDIRRARDELGYAPRVDLAAGIAANIAGLREASA